MPSVFTRIIDGDLPGHFVYRDDVCVAFLSIEPLRRGHTLVVPIQEVDHWLDLDDASVNHLLRVSRTIGEVLQAVYNPRKVGLMIAGLEVPHVHIHLVPINQPHDLDFANAAPASSDELALEASRIAAGLAE
ncbi:MAG: HIT family protein [Acidimicrobiia bacterium]